MTEEPVTSANQLSLVPSETQYRQLDGNREIRVVVPFLDYIVDGRPLRAMLREAGYHDDLVTVLCRPWPQAAAETVEQLMGGATGQALGVDMLVCKLCGDRDCGALVADVTAKADRVTWTNWHFTNPGGAEPVAALRDLAFERERYVALLQTAAATVAELPYDEDANRPRRFLWPWQWGWRLP